MSAPRRRIFSDQLDQAVTACKDGWMEILRFQLDSRHRPCNLVELMPRLQEHLKAG